MTRHVDLPYDHWAELYEGEEITGRRTAHSRRANAALPVEMAAKLAGVYGDAKTDTNVLVAVAMGQMGLSADEADALDGLQAAQIADRVAAWDFPFPPTPDSVADLPVEVINELATEVNKRRDPTPTAAATDAPAGEVETPADPTGPSTPSKRNSKAATARGGRPAGSKTNGGASSGES